MSKQLINVKLTKEEKEMIAESSNSIVRYIERRHRCADFDNKDCQFIADVCIKLYTAPKPKRKRSR